MFTFLNIFLRTPIPGFAGTPEPILLNRFDKFLLDFVVNFILSFISDPDLSYLVVLESETEPMRVIKISIHIYLVTLCFNCIFVTHWTQLYLGCWIIGSSFQCIGCFVWWSGRLWIVMRVPRDTMVQDWARVLDLTVIGFYIHKTGLLYIYIIACNPSILFHPLIDGKLEIIRK